MPVFSRSDASMAAMVPLPPSMMSRRRSASSLAPLRMMPPSRMVRGGSSTSVFSMRSAQSVRGSMAASSFLSRGESHFCSCAFTSGSARKPRASPSKSRQLTVPVTMRVCTRSKSVTSRSASSSSPRTMTLSVSSSTAPWRRVISTGSSRGFSSQERSIRPPMAVWVLSSTHRSVPRFSLERMVSVSSRFRRASKSSSMNRPVV